MLHLFHQLFSKLSSTSKVTAILAASLPGSHRCMSSPGYQRPMCVGGWVGGLWAGLVFEDSTILPSGTGLSVCVGGEDTDDNIASIKPNTQKS